MVNVHGAERTARRHFHAPSQWYKYWSLGAAPLPLIDLAWEVRERYLQNQEKMNTKTRVCGC